MNESTRRPDAGNAGVGFGDGPIRLHEAPLDVDFGDEKGWSAWHGWQDGVTTWVDGSLVADGKREANYLDVGCFGDECCIRDEWRGPAEVAWKAGSVLEVEPYENSSGVRALIVPTATLTMELIDAAVRRFHAQLSQ
jgi:hypothetical protein